MVVLGWSEGVGIGVVFGLICGPAGHRFFLLRKSYRDRPSSSTPSESRDDSFGLLDLPICFGSATALDDGSAPMDKGFGCLKGFKSEIWAFIRR